MQFSSASFLQPSNVQVFLREEDDDNYEENDCKKKYNYDLEDVRV
jgi:hypothetical protein